MNEKQFEECSLEEATHVEMGGKMYLLGGNEARLESYHGEWIGIRCKIDSACIPLGLFPILGIKPLKEKKREPIVFEAVVRDKYSVSIPEGIPLGTKFKCVEIVEEKK